MLRFNDNVSADPINNPTGGSAFYFWKIKMATDQKLVDNPLNNHHRAWWDNERKRIEGLRDKKLRLVR